MPDGVHPQRVFFTLDNVHVDFASANGGQDFQYQPNPRLAPLSREEPTRPYRLKPGNVLDVEVRAPLASSVRGAGTQAGPRGSGSGLSPRARASTWGLARRRCACTSATASAW